MKFNKVTDMFFTYAEQLCPTRHRMESNESKRSPSLRPPQSCVSEAKDSSGIARKSPDVDRGRQQRQKKDLKNCGKITMKWIDQAQHGPTILKNHVREAAMQHVG